MVLRQLAAAAERKTIDRRNHRLREALDRTENSLPLFGGCLSRDWSHLRELADVRSSDECLFATAGDDDRLDGIVVASRGKNLRDLIDRRSVESVERLRTVDGDDEKA